MPVLLLSMLPRIHSIRPPASFLHAAALHHQEADQDPRLKEFRFDEVEIALQGCEFIRPAAALWCVVYLALARARGCTCRIVVPNNMGVCAHLKTTKVLEVLKEQGVEVDDRGITPSNPKKVILPVTCFRTQQEVQAITNLAHDQLSNANLSSPNLNSMVSELFSELALNAVQHSESEVGAFGCIQFLEFGEGPRFVCVVADGGIGVRASLLRNPNLPRRVHYDWDALDLAVRERVSGTGDPHRGIGLSAVVDQVRSPDSSLILHSGFGLLSISEDQQLHAKRTRLFPGTLASLSMPG